MTALALVILVLMLVLAGAVAYGVHHRRQRSGGIIGVDRPAGRSKGRSA
ncbi:MAG TPA: hypothetical protein VMZ00_17440 [Sporichthya sp.]|nr:hypothetical protein [Sporichthya sp.]